MKYPLAVLALSLIGGCAGRAMEVSWSKPLEPDPRVAGSDPTPEIFWGVDVAPRILKPRNLYRWRSTGESREPESPPLRTWNGELQASPLEKLDPRLPESLMVPWRGFGSSTPATSAFLWSHVDPGLRELGWFGPAPGWAR